MVKKYSRKENLDKNRVSPTKQSDSFKWKGHQMKKIFLFVFLGNLCTLQIARAETSVALKCLWSSYRNFKISADKKDIIFLNNGVMPFQSRLPHGTPLDRTHLTSIDQMFIRPYPKGFKISSHGKKTYATPIATDQLIGNRYQPLFKAFYGHSPLQVERDLADIQWIDGTWLQFNRRYGAARSLQQVVEKLKILIRQRPDLRKYLIRPAGTYEWRSISHQENLSTHSFGIAIDINARYSDYWRWYVDTNPEPHYRNKIPAEIADIFEQQGFIWGGKWYHYDTMHFEYRPELLKSARDCEKEFAAYRD